MDEVFYKIDKPANLHGLKGPALFRETRKDKDILFTMDEDTYEEFIATWAYYCVKNKAEGYQDVLRIGGSGGGGMDVAAFYHQENRDCDIYQCKHYNSPINKSSILPELGKFLYHVFTSVLPCPRTYFLMAPKGLSAKFTHIYTNSGELKSTILKEWDEKISTHIEKGQVFANKGALKTFLQNFDYTIFKFYSPERIIEDLLDSRNRHVYTQYFGVRKEIMERKKIEVPMVLIDYEDNYIRHLLEAYTDANGNFVISKENVRLSKYQSHFKRSREEFWLAESIKKMSVENCPGDCDDFNELMNDMYYHVADIYEEEYDNAYCRLKAVTDKATSFVKKERIISGELGSPELKGICFQLSNEDRLVWKKI